MCVCLQKYCMYVCVLRLMECVCVCVCVFTKVLYVCLCVKADGVTGYKVSCTFLFVDMRINQLSPNQSYAVVAMCSDKEIIDALLQSPYSFICFCVPPEDFFALNVIDGVVSFRLYKVVMTEAYHDVKNRLNTNWMENDIRGIVYVQWPLLLTWFNFNPSMDM